MSHYKYFEDYDSPDYCTDCDAPLKDREEFQEGIANWVYHKNLRNYEPE